MAIVPEMFLVSGVQTGGMRMADEAEGLMLVRAMHALPPNSRRVALATLDALAILPASEAAVVLEALREKLSASPEGGRENERASLDPPR